MSQIKFSPVEIRRIGKKTTERMEWDHRFPPMLAAKVGMVGHSLVRGGEFEFRRPAPEFQQVMVVLCGEGRVWFRGKWRDLQAGEAFLSPSHEAHAYHVGRSWELVWCIFKPDTFPQLQGAPAVRKVNAELWRHIVMGVLEETSHPTDSMEPLEYWVSILMLEARRLLVDNRESLLASLWSEVRRSLSFPWTLELLASKAGMNVETLRLQCLRELKMSPVAYLVRLRMGHAAEMLKYGSKVAYVAQAVGYDSQFTFSTAFRRVMGVPPSALKPKRFRSPAGGG